jgi:hypothetical protein
VKIFSPKKLPQEGFPWNSICEDFFLQKSSHWKDFREILYVKMFSPKKSVEITQVSLQSDKNK